MRAYGNLDLAEGSRFYPGGVPWQTRSIVKIREELILKALAGEELALSGSPFRSPIITHKSLKESSFEGSSCGACELSSNLQFRQRASNPQAGHAFCTTSVAHVGIRYTNPFCPTKWADRNLALHQF